MNPYRKLAALLDRRERRNAALVFLLLLAVAFVEVVGVASVMPFMAVLANPSVIETNPVLNAVYDSLGFTSTNGFLIFLGGVVLVVLIGSLILKALGHWAQLRFSHMRNHVLGCRLVGGYLRQPYEWFLNRPSSGLATTILSEVQQVISQALFPAMQVFANGLVVVFLVVLLLLIDPMLAISVAVVLGGAYSVIFAVSRRYLQRIGRERREANRRRFQLVQETFGGIKDVKINGLEGPLLNRFERASRVFAQRIVAANVLAELPSFAMQALLFGGMMLVLLYLMTVHGTFQEALPVMTVYAFAGYRLMPALQGAYRSMAQLRFSEAALNALHEDLQSLAATEASLGRETNSAERLNVRASIVLDDVWYAYPEARNAVVCGVSLQIAANSKIGFVGRSGSGKTTLADLLLALLEPSKGRIEVDGQVLSKGNRRAWQNNLGYVPQSIFLLDSTVASNIAFGLPPHKMDLQAVELAARIANLHDFVVNELPHGYETQVGERGVRLSGGQRQRIGIARALYRDPAVLIMDEATSALDNVTERIVMEAVDNLSGSKTVILVAHRLSTVKDCDCIFVLDGGELIASGTYDELMQGSDAFQRLAAVSA